MSLRAFALGSSVEWISTGVGVEGGISTIRIIRSRNSRNVFEWEELDQPRQDVGTVFRAANVGQKPLLSLEAPKSREMIEDTFAPIISGNPAIQISLDSGLLNPSEQIAYDRTYSEMVEASGQQIPLTVRIIEWKAGAHQQLIFRMQMARLLMLKTVVLPESPFSYAGHLLARR
jgi:hypothetical protein